ncbi:MAG: HNH endonuclease family protein [Nitrosotalea sp.]
MSLIEILKKGYHNREWPNDSEFHDELINSHLYYHDFCKVILEELELLNNKEPVNMKNLSIEHIMPQVNGQVENLSENWKNMLGDNYKDVYEKWLHTLGNITLTGYNSEYQDSRFEDKKNMPNGFKESRVKLNQEIAKEVSWNENIIKSRGKRLADRAIEIWKYY